MKFLVMVIICLNILFAQEENTNIVKTSELELFLFKIGFESLLKDVDSTKNKSNINEEELRRLNSKVELIMNEIYKEKRIITSDTNSPTIINSSNNQEIEILKKEINLLKIQMKEISQNKIQESKIEKQNQVSLDIKQEIGIDNQMKKIKVNRVNVREKPTTNSDIVEVLEKDTQVEIEFCDKYDWCKFKGEEKYISKYLLY